MHLPDSELAVIQLLWDQSPQTAEELIARLAAERGWSASTVKTLLARLVKKGALRFERDGRRFLYAPLLEREAYVDQASKSFLDTLFGGRLAPLVAHLSDRRALTEEDRRQLARLLREIEARHDS